MDKKYFNDEFTDKLKNDGWMKVDAGGTKTIDYNNSRAVYVKEISEADIVNISATDISKNQAISMVSAIDTNSSRDIGGRWSECDSLLDDICMFPYKCFSATDKKADFSILNDMRSDEDNLIVRADSIWVDNPSKVISYNFSIYRDGKILNFMFFPYSDVLHSLTINYMLGRIFDYIGIPRYDRRGCIYYEYIAGLDRKGNPIREKTNKFSEAKKNGVYAYINDKPSPIKFSDVDEKQKPYAKTVHKCIDYKKIRYDNITLLVFHGLRFFSSTDIDASYGHDFIRSGLLKGNENGIFTIQPHYFACNSTVNNGWNYMYAVKADVRDIAAHSVVDGYGVWKFTDGIGCNIDRYKDMIEKQFERQLPKLFVDNPPDYADYALDRNVIVLLYMFKLWGTNKKIPCTLLSDLDKRIAEKLSEFFNCENGTDYLAKYSGTAKYRGSARDIINKNFGRIGKYTPIDDDCNELQQYASKAFRGGYIGCDNICVHHGKITYDYDLISAYTIGMAMLLDINWDEPIYDRLSPNAPLAWEDFEVDGEITPMVPIFAKVKFEFDESYPYPCLPYGKENGKGLVDCEFYPIKNDDGVYCCGPELYLAMKMGAKITVINGIVADVRHNSDGNISQSLRPIVSEYVRQRAEASKTFGKDSIEAAILKRLVNSIYGKIAQNVTDMYMADSNNGTDDMAESRITNNVFAAMITSIVRATILAAMNEVKQAGYNVYSATTDGLITDMPLAEFEDLDLFGLKPFLMDARKYLTDEDNPKLWAIKHQQDDLINLSSTCNGSLIVEEKGHLGGVIAHSGYSTDAPKKSAEGRAEFFEAVATRTGPVKTQYEQYPTLDKIKKGALFLPERKEKSCNFDYDMKRKPVKDSLRAEYVEVDGNTCEIAHIETVPYVDAEEYLLYNKVKKSHKCLRTVDEWNLFFKDVELKRYGCTEKPHTKDYGWKYLCDVIKGYKKGLWDIPYLNQPDLTVTQKCEWIQSFNTSTEHTYTSKDWARASEKKRQNSILPYAVLQDVINSMNGSNREQLSIDVQDDIDIDCDYDCDDDLSYWDSYDCDYLTEEERRFQEEWELNER